MALKGELASIVGSEYVSDDPDTLERYSKDYSFVQPRRPSCVAYPENTEEIQGIVKYANEHLIPVTPRSSGVSFYGAGIPSQGGIILDLTRMNKILEVDGRDRKVRVEPGVTWAQVQEELGKEGLMVCNPLLPHPLKSVLTSSMEREPILIPKSEYNETLQTAEMVLANGELFYTGTAIAKGHIGRSSPEHFIPSNRLFIGTQGTLGIMTWAILKAEWLPAMDKLFFVAFDINPDEYTFETSLAEDTSYSDTLDKAIEMEEKIIKFYSDAAEQSKSLMADVPRAFIMVAKKRNDRRPKLRSLLGDEG